MVKVLLFYIMLFHSIYGGLAYRLYRFVTCMVFLESLPVCLGLCMVQ